MNIVLFGSGNVATYFMQQWSISKDHCIFLATNNQVFKDSWINKNSNCFEYANQDISIDVYVLAIKDDGIESKITSIPSSTNALVVHTSGAMHINLLEQFNRHGVLYPLQSFSKQNQLAYKDFPYLIESNHPDDLHLIKKVFPKHLNYLECNSEDRKKHHLAAVITANFTNHLLCLVQNSLANTNFQIESLKELLFETLHKSFESGPCINQTGPAARKDYTTLATHQEMLAENAELLNIYNTLTKSILNKHTNE
jgi:predicted short-subunit dehydrogenase-like oxidoreductase (DUF2520 family)